MRALGVSNFGVRHLTELLADGPKLHIAVNQVPWLSGLALLAWLESELNYGDFMLF